ncbi:MAG: phosphoribosyltransferase [Patescibacteria group bacterium]|nr:phosphoribosyltransferase [Patescibacteria group bacterium]
MFTNRQEAGKLLAKKLVRYKNQNLVIVGITRGGVVVAKELSSFLQAPFLPIVVKKIGAPGNPELAVGAVTYGKTLYLDRELAQKTEATKEFLSEQIKLKYQEVESLAFRFKTKQISLRGKNAIVVDDGIATGATMEAVIKYLKKEKAAKIIIAVPVVSKETYLKMKKEVSGFVALEIPVFFNAVGEFYQDFPQVSDEEVEQTLKKFDT